MPAALVAAGIAAYLGSFGGVFLFDDLRNIVENPNVHRFASLRGSLPGDDRPLVSLSLALNYAIGGLNPWSYHLFNLVVHLLAALTLFGVVAGTRARRGSPPRSGIPPADSHSWSPCCGRSPAPDRERDLYRPARGIDDGPSATCSRSTA
jgi:hypothetical protein